MSNTIPVPQDGAKIALHTGINDRLWHVEKRIHVIEIFSVSTLSRLGRGLGRGVQKLRDLQTEKVLNARIEQLMKKKSSQRPCGYLIA